MRKGFKVYNIPTVPNNNCIVVSNYHNDNEVYNWPLNENDISKLKCDIGVWKIKKT